MEAKEMLKQLRASGYGEFPDGQFPDGQFPDGQLRTLQRRVRVLRVWIVQQRVYGTG
jgi:hypothetical protein